MRNMMREYLGTEYSENNIKNFCRYWLKASEGSGDEWRAENDLGCLYFDGDLRAGTLINTWLPIKRVADHINKESGMRFYRVASDHEDPGHYLKLLLENPDVYLPRKHPLVELLYRFLELAELRCNYICLPDRDTKPVGYCTTIGHRDYLILYLDTPEVGDLGCDTTEQELKDMLQQNIDLLLARLAQFKAEEERITCDRIQKMYEYMKALPMPFLYMEVYKPGHGSMGYKLFYIKEVTTGHCETDMWVDIEGIDRPGERFEWIQLVLEATDGDKTIRRICLLDSRKIYDETIEETLERNQIIIPDMVW